MELKGKKAPKKAVKKKTSTAPAGKGKRPKKKKAGVAPDPISKKLEDDEVITPETTLEEESEQMSTAPEVLPVKAFEAGLVSAVLKDATNAHWGRTEETTLLISAMKDAYLINGVFVGDIVIKPSFVKRSKGSALL